MDASVSWVTSGLWKFSSCSHSIVLWNRCYRRHINSWLRFRQNLLQKVTCCYGVNLHEQPNKFPNFLLLPWIWLDSLAICYVLARLFPRKFTPYDLCHLSCGHWSWVKVKASYCNYHWNHRWNWNCRLRRRSARSRPLGGCLRLGNWLPRNFVCRNRKRIFAYAFYPQKRALRNKGNKAEFMKQ